MLLLSFTARNEDEMDIPDLQVQRNAMKRLHSLAGAWKGDARLWDAAGSVTDIVQTETATYWLDGLLLVIEGIGNEKGTGKPLLHAMAIISYDDARSEYRMLVFTEGRRLESELAVEEEGKLIRWGFVMGEIETASWLRITAADEWTEGATLTAGSAEPRTLIEMRCTRAT